MLLSHASRLICVLLEQTLCCSIQRLRQSLLHLLREVLFEEEPLTSTNSARYHVHVFMQHNKVPDLFL
jgi:hypothetical protein